VAHGELAAAVSAAGGLGTVGGLSLSPSALRKELAELKRFLADKGTANAPFGVDLALPKVGDGARKTNHDYTVRGSRASPTKLTPPSTATVS